MPALRAALALFSTVLGLLAVEGGVRLLGDRPVFVPPDRTRFWMYDDQLGWRCRPGQQGLFEIEERDMRIPVSINSAGLRDREHDLVAADGRPRILVLGDSFTWGLGVGGEERFTDELQRLMPAAEVINAGVSGYSTDQELLWFRSRGRLYGPSLVVVQWSGNDDLYDHLARAYMIYNKPWFELSGDGLALRGVPVPRVSPWERAPYALARVSALAARLYLRFQWRSIERALRRMEAEAATHGPFALSIRLLEQIRTEARQAGAGMVVVTSLTEGLSPAEKRYAEFRQALRDRAFTVLCSEDIQGFDRSSMLFANDFHWNRLGHALVGKALHRTIVEGRILPPDRTPAPAPSNPGTG